MFGAHFYFWAGFGTDELIQHASCVAQLGLSTRTVCVRELLLLLRPTPQFDKFDRALDHPPYVVPPTETYEAISAGGILCRIVPRSRKFG